MMEKNMIFTQIVRPLVILIAIVFFSATLGAIAWYGWLEFSGEMEVRKLEAQAAALQAQAEADEAAAERANAEAVLAPAEAAALTVERQSAVFVYYSVLTPVALIIVAFVLVVAGGSGGAILTLLVLREKNNG